MGGPLFFLNINMLDKRYGYFVTALSKTSEPIRTTKWLVNFNFSELRNASTFPSADILSFHVKDVEVPAFQTETDSMYFYGIERKLPTSINNAGTISMSILEGEKLIGYNSILRWNQQCVNGSEFSEGESTIITNPFNSKYAINFPDFSTGDIVNSNVVSISCFSYVTGDELFKIKFLNIKPTKIGSVKLAYEGNELYKYDITFDYDLAILEKARSGVTFNQDASSEA